MAVYNNNSSICGDSSTFSMQETIISGFLMLFVICFGIVANILNILVFGSSHMWRSSLINWYLALLAVFDLLALVCSMTMNTLPVLCEYTGHYQVASIATRFMYVAYPIGLMAQTASVWLTVCVSAHRFIGVTIPFRAHMFCSKRAVRRNLICVVVFCVLYNLSRFFELDIRTCWSVTNNAFLADVHATNLRGNNDYVNIYHGWLYMIFMLLGPFILLIVMNLVVVHSVHQARERHRFMSLVETQNAQSSAVNDDEAAKERKTTIMLVGIVVVFMALNVLSLVCNLLELAAVQTYSVLIDASNLLMTINFSINIVIYYWFSDRYRAVLHYYISFLLPHVSTRKMFDIMAQNFDPAAGNLVH